MKKVPLATLAVLMVLPLIACVLAENNPNVYTTKEDGTTTNKFSSGEKIRIIACSADPLPYEIIVIDVDGNVRFTATSYVQNYNETVSGITDKSGWWEVKAGTAKTHYAVSWYQVVPEVPIGSAIAIAACFAALGINLLRRRAKYEV